MKKIPIEMNCICPKCGAWMNWDDWKFEFQCPECEEVIEVKEPDWEK